MANLANKPSWFSTLLGEQTSQNIDIVKSWIEKYYYITNKALIIFGNIKKYDNT